MNITVIKKIENIPDDFTANVCIELNKELKGMTEIEVKLQYENDGYKENYFFKSYFYYIYIYYE